MRRQGFKAEHLEDAIADIQAGRKRRTRPWVVHQKHGDFEWWFKMDDLETRVNEALEGVKAI